MGLQGPRRNMGPFPPMLQLSLLLKWRLSGAPAPGPGFSLRFWDLPCWEERMSSQDWMLLHH